MLDVVFSKHAKQMLLRRKILEDWVWRVINTPEEKRRSDDGHIHYIKPIRENSGRVLRVVVDPSVQPNRIVTLFFDRRLGKTK